MKVILTEDRQTLFDVAVQVYGKLDGLVMLCQDNNLEFDAIIMPGTKLTIREDLINEPTADENVVNLFVMRGVQVCIGDEIEDPAILLQNNGYPIDQNDGGAIFI